MLLGITKVGNKNVAPFVWGAIAARDLTVKRKTQIPRTSRVPPPPLRPGGLGRYCPILASQSPGGGGGCSVAVWLPQRRDVVGTDFEVPCRVGGWRGGMVTPVCTNVGQ